MIAKTHPLLPRIPLMPVLVAFFGLCGSLVMGLQAAPGATRLAVLASPGAWPAIERSGLPVVQVLWGGMLVVVDAGQNPEGRALLRAAPLLVLNAQFVPGCSPVISSEGGDNDPDA